MDNTPLQLREIITLELFHQGFSKKEIDKQLQIGGGIIPMLQSHIIQKLNVSSWAEALIIYQQQYRVNLCPEELKQNAP
jgi:DNA-binding CsgD family transcriptional regulator